MLDPSIITRGAERAQLQQQQTNEMLGNLGGALGQMVLGRRINQMRQLGTPDEQKAFANNSIFAPQLNQVLKSDQVTAQKNAIDLLKAQAEIGKTNSEATKNNAQAGGFTLDNSQKKFGAIQGVFQQAAMTGDKGQVLLGLDALQRSGVISPDDYAHNFSIIQAMTRDEVKNYAKGIVFTNKDTAPLIYQSANNAADNSTSIANNVRTTNATLTGQKIAAETAEKNRIQQDKQFQKNFEYRAQQDEIKNGQGELKEFGGKVYLVYKNGTYRPAIGEDGQQITSQPKGANSTAAAQNEERQRISRVNAVLDEIQGILPQATASYAGRGIDLLARGVGLATPGDVATGKLGTLGGQLVALMPKMSGPQSDKDVAMYKQMAGQLDDPTIPLQVRQAALETIRSLNNKYAEMNSQRPSTVPYRNNAPANTQPQSQAKLNNILFGK
ncbi:TPA: hypothetical protein ACJESZ_000650 [Acinetobacter baumannii]